MSSKLGEMLLAKKVVTDAQLKMALDTQNQIGGKLGAILVKLHFVTEDQLAALVGEQLKIPVMKLGDLVVEPNVSQMVDLEICEKHQILPLRRTKDSVLVAAVDPLDFNAMNDLQFLTGLRVECAAVSRGDLHKAIAYYFHGSPCAAIGESERERALAAGQTSGGAAAGTRASPQQVLQALTELLIDKKLITREELLEKLPGTRS